MVNESLLVPVVAVIMTEKEPRHPSEFVLQIKLRILHDKQDAVNVGMSGVLVFPLFASILEMIVCTRPCAAATADGVLIELGMRIADELREIERPKKGRFHGVQVQLFLIVV
jgi:hypothetical protein